MKYKIFMTGIIVACFSLALLAGGCHHRGDARRAEKGKYGEEVGGAETATVPGEQATLSFTAADEDSVDLAEKEEIRRKYTLKPGSSVHVRGINGGVKIDTADSDTAEVLIVRSAKKREDLQYHKINIEHGDDNLTIRVESDRKSLFSAIGSQPEGHQRVVLRLPRKVDLEVNGSNGKVAIGDIRGQLRMSGMNGEVKATHIAGETEIHGMNGGLDISFAPLTGNGIEIAGVNGNIDLRFEGEVNADLNAFGVNGQVTPDLPDVQNKGEESGRGRVRARIGTGGSQIRINGINGNVTLMKAEKQGGAVAKTKAK